MNFRWSTRMPDETAGPALYQAEMPNSPGMPIMERGGPFGKQICTVNNLAYIYKKARGPLTTPLYFSLLADFFMFSRHTFHVMMKEPVRRTLGRRLKLQVAADFSQVELTRKRRRHRDVIHQLQANLTRTHSTYGTAKNHIHVRFAF